MNERVLFVDDEPNVLEGIRRGLGRKLEMETAPGGSEALELLDSGQEFAVVVSDMRMPGMDGATFLKHVRERQPDSVRMILSGQAELESTIAAVNEGHIFRFLMKPCPADKLEASVRAGLEQYRLVMAERALLEDTLSGAVGLLTEVLALVSPLAFSKAARVEQYAVALAEQLQVEDTWQIRLAALLSQLGCLAVPDEVLAKADTESGLDAEEQEIFAEHPALAARLLTRIPRLEGVAAMVARQADSVAEGLGPDVKEWDSERLGGHVLEVAIAFDRHLCAGLSHGEAQARLAQATDGRPKALLSALARVPLASADEETRLATVADLRLGMVLEDEIRLEDGVLLVAQGHEVTDSLLARLRSFARRGSVREPFKVRVSRTASTEAEVPQEVVAAT